MNENRILSNFERSKLHENEREVIDTYEKITTQSFKRFELLSLKKVIRVATPAQIIAEMKRLYTLYPENFNDFHYLVRPVMNRFKNRRGKKKGDIDEKKGRGI